tara:strand:+ start:333 stop:506 length:174 start_codon:yes stop_codon:yes gene_type:complete
MKGAVYKTTISRNVVFLRQYNLDQVPRDFLRWFIPKPPPLTKFFQFIAIERNVKQNV